MKLPSVYQKTKAVLSFSVLLQFTSHMSIEMVKTHILFAHFSRMTVKRENKNLVCAGTSLIVFSLDCRIRNKEIGYSACLIINPIFHWAVSALNNACVFTCCATACFSRLSDMPSALLNREHAWSIFLTKADHSIATLNQTGSQTAERQRASSQFSK